MLKEWTKQDCQSKSKNTHRKAGAAEVHRGTLRKKLTDTSDFLANSTPGQTGH